MHKADDDPRPTAVWADTTRCRPGLEGNDGCLQCHERLRTNVSAHTQARGKFVRKQLLQLPHALHDLRVVAGLAQSSDQLANRRRQRRNRKTKRVQSLSSRQDAVVDVAVPGGLV